MYVIMGEAGIYSDRDVWCIGVVDTEDQAKKYVK